MEETKRLRQEEWDRVRKPDDPEGQWGLENLKFVN